MNIKVITRHGPSNYGSLLQAFATLTALRDMGHDAEIIDYQRPDERGMGRIRAELAKKPRWNSNPLLKAAYIALRRPAEQLAQSRFDRMRNRYLDMTPRVISSDELRRLSADIFMTGSDQVWGPVASDNHDPAYFFDFVTDGTPRVAYAASFGKTTAPEVENMLRRYAAITVRESAAADMIAAMGLPRPPQVLDPTLLLDGGRWRSLLSLGEEPAPSRKPYILVYQIHSSDQVDRRVKEAQGLTGMRVLRVSPMAHQFTRPGHLKLLPTLPQFLKLIDNASLMLTDSFHGTAFAINLNTPFATVLPSNGTQSRNQSILRLSGLENRVIAPDSDLAAIIGAPVDFGPVNEKIEAERRKSLSLLKEILTVK